MTHGSRRMWLVHSLTGLWAVSVSGCGTILYPERRGQPAGRLDWGVVALDGIGLLLFFVPGVIAFAVDFVTGAIYLPPEYCGQSEVAQTQSLRKVHSGALPLTRGKIEAVVSEASGQPIRLDNGTFLTEPLARLDQFWPRLDRLQKTGPPPVDRPAGHS
jgi:hypothetical protein